MQHFDPTPEIMDLEGPGTPCSSGHFRADRSQRLVHKTDDGLEQPFDMATVDSAPPISPTASAIRGIECLTRKKAASRPTSERQVIRRLPTSGFDAATTTFEFTPAHPVQKKKKGKGPAPILGHLVDYKHRETILNEGAREAAIMYTACVFAGNRWTIT